MPTQRRPEHGQRWSQNRNVESIELLKVNVGGEALSSRQESDQDIKQRCSDTDETSDKHESNMTGLPLVFGKWILSRVN